MAKQGVKPDGHLGREADPLVDALRERGYWRGKMGKLQRLTYVCVIALGAACTPIGNPKQESGAVNPPAADHDAAVMRVAAATADMSCDQASARSCGTDDPKQVLVCQDGSWHPDTPCSDDERCVTKSKLTVECSPSVAACIGQERGFLFCDANGKRLACLDEAWTTEVACDTLERCVMENGEPKCRCVPGAVFKNGCVPATSCEPDNGGCDPATTCTSGASGRECGQCPADKGFLGDGASGCAPQLLSFTPSCGVLEPALTAGVYEYKLHAPIFCPQLHIDGMGPAGSTVKINAVDAAAQWSWDSPPLRNGETTLPVDITSGFGVTTQYTFTIVREVKQVAYLKASNGDANDNFGQALAASGDAVFVSALREDSSSATDPGSNDAADSGAVYLFAPQRDGWVELPYLKGNPVVAGEYFGAALAATADTLVATAPNRDPVHWYRRDEQTVATRAGSVYIFQRGPDGWKQQSKLTPAEGSTGDVFGFSVALFGDTLVVGAPGDSPNGVELGAVYVFTRSGDTWSELQKIPAPDGTPNTMFGTAVSVNAERIVVGASHDSKMAQNTGAAFTFVLDAGKWRMEQRVDPQPAGTSFTAGCSTLIAGHDLLVGAPGLEGLNPRGIIRTFQMDAGGAWKQGKTLQAPYSNQADLFGAHFVQAGSTLIVTANGDSSGADGVDGDASRSDSYLSGAVHMFAPDASGSWRSTTYFKASNPGQMDYFGVGLAAGETALFVGSPGEDSTSHKTNEGQDDNGAADSGAVYVFR